jgi:hypothetical protein
MQHSNRFESIQSFYDSGAWDTQKLRDAVMKNWITKEEFRIITGHDF